MPPSEYLRRRFHTDTVSDNPAALRMAIDLYGSEKVMFGSDFPWWTAPTGIELVRSTLHEREVGMVLGENAARLLNLDSMSTSAASVPYSKRQPTQGDAQWPR